MDGSDRATGRQLLVMAVAGRLVAMAAAEVRQVLPVLPLWRPPTAPAPLRGFAVVAGGVLPVLATRTLLGLGEEAAPGLYAHIVRVGGIAGREAGLLVDRAEDFVTPAAPEPLGNASALNGCATALFRHRGTVGWVIEPARLLGLAESAALAALAAEAERRRVEWIAAA